MNAYLEHDHVSAARLALRLFVGQFFTKTDEKYHKLIYLSSDRINQVKSWQNA